MQKGFATLEIIFVVLIISILSAFAVPKAKQLVERVTLDYEQKRLYSELKFLQTLSRSASVTNLGMEGLSTISQNNQAIMFFYYGNTYEILRTNKLIRRTHYLSNDVNFSLGNTDSFVIWCDAAGKFRFNAKNPYTGSQVTSRTIVLTPKNFRGEKYLPTIVFDSVGRIRGGREER